MRIILHNMKRSRATKGLPRVSCLFVFVLALLAYAPVAKAQLNGTYTICPASAGTCNYTSIGSAINDLNSVGVSGPVVFNIYGGNYNEYLTMNSISTVNATNTITFNGNGSSPTTTGTNGTGVTRVYGSSTLWNLNGCSYVTLQNMVLEQTSSSYTVYNYYTQYCTIKNCQLKFPTGTCCSYNSFDYYSYKTTWANNYFRGGYMNLYASAASGSTSYGSNTYKNNTFRMAYYYGIYMYGYSLNVMDGNSFDSAYYYGYNYDYYGMGNTWKNNKFGNSNMYYGLMMYYPNTYGTTYPQTAVNNMFYGQQYYGLYLYIGNTTNCNVHVQHNSFNENNGYYGMYCYGYSSSGWEITNNNFVQNGSGAAAYIYASSTENVDGNNFYSAGSTLVYYGNGTGYADISTYKVAAAKNGHGTYDQNVQSYYKAVNDLHLDQTKAAPYGKSVGVLLDIDGDTRCTLFPTSGADECFFGKGTFKAKITGTNTVYAGTPTVFFNNAKLGEPKVHAWYLDKISTGTKLSDSIILLTTALTVGTHKIYLVSTGCAGTSTDSFNVTVVNPTKAPVVDFISDKNIIKQGEVVKFTDLSTNGPNKWVWKISPDSILYNGNKVATFKFMYGTNYSTYRLTAQFNYGGKYKVCLTTSNAAGTGTTNCKVAYIEVIPTINIGSVSTITDPKGNLYDDGGPNGNYSYTGTSYRKTTIDPCADSVYLVLNYFNTWCGYDFLRIYEGDKSGKALHLPCTTTIGYNVGFTGGPVSTFCNGSLPGCLPNTIQNYKTGGTIDTFRAKTKMYLEFEGEYAYNASGFEAFWWTKPRTEPKPKASFSSVSSICTNGVVNFTNTTTGNNLSYLWDLDGDPSYFEYNGKNTSWPYFFPGTVPVMLIATNCGGSDTFIKTITVFDPPAPTASFTADNTTPTTNDIVYMSTKGIKACVDAYSWKITKKYPYTSGTTPTVVYVNGSSSSSPNPAINLPDTGCWDVALTVTNVAGSNSTFTSCYLNVKGSYCAPTVSTLVPDIGISKVVFNTIANSSTQGATEYQNFTPTVSTTVEIGVKYKLTVERTSNKNNVTRSVYFDWNGDGDFNDASEFYANDSGSSALSWSTDVTIPNFATKGASVMRIAINQGNYNNKPCGQNEFGEYEDYRIYITPDQTAPVIKIKTKGGQLVDADTVYVEQGLHYGDLGAQALDNLDGDISANITTTQSPTFNKLIPGTYKFIYNVMDAGKNAAISKTRVVIVTVDKSAPTLYVSLPETTTVQVGNPVKIPVVIAAEDSLDGDVTGTVVVNNPVVASKIGMYTVTYSDSDSYGNKVIVYRYINIIDSIPPVMSLNGKDSVYVQVGTSYTDAGVTPTDNYNTIGDLNKNTTKVGSVNTSKIGIYPISFITSDESGNKSNTVKRVVIVFDSIKPVISMKGNVKVDLDVYSTWNEPGVDATDNYYVQSTLTKKVTGTFYDAFSNGTPTKLGTYTIIYRFTDGSGNTDSVVRTINVVDRVAPLITLKGDPSVSICRWAVYSDAGYDLKDNYWANTDITVTKEGSFSTFSTLLNGLYSFRYKAVDKSNNIGYSAYRYILVKPAEDVSCFSTVTPATDLAKMITVYPNPNTGKFIIKASINTNEKVRISVSNMYGQEIAVVNNGILNNNQFEVDLSTQAAGMYTVSIMMNNTVVTKQVMVTR